MRAEEIIAAVYKRRSEIVREGRRPEKVVLSKANYDLLEDYRRRLPPFPPGIPDYITQYSLFDLPIYVDDSCDCDVL